MSSARISPTAHYTGYVWARHGLSHPALATAEGRVLFESLRPIMGASSALGGDSLENYLMARHTAIDALLTRAIEEQGIRQVVELACGLSPRGWRFRGRYGPELTYVEADLPDMAERKREALERIGPLPGPGTVVALDVLREGGPESLEALADQLRPEQGLVIITEGLLGYLATEAVLGLWRRLAQVLAPLRAGLYISDLHLASEQTPQVRAFRMLLSAFVRGRVHLHFDAESEAEDGLRQAGFDAVSIHPARELSPSEDGGGSERAHIIEASTA